MPHRYHLSRVSGNTKTGPIPVTTSSSTTCPGSCPLKNNGCYAETGPLALHWRAITQGTRGYDLAQLCTQIKKLPKHQLWRFAQAGDLPGEDDAIDCDALQQIVEANANRRGYAYTHYPAANPQNAAAIRQAIVRGFTINLSANSLEHADELADLSVAPVVTLLLPDQLTSTVTPKGRLVAICPAVTHDDINCANCGICAVPNRKSIIGFPAHGTGKKRATKVFHRSKGRAYVQ